MGQERLLDIDGTDPHSLTKAEIEGRRQVVALMKFLNEYCPGLENAYLMDTGAQAGIRETRRIKGKYMLSREDVLQPKRFDDSIARFSFFLDIHNPDGSGSSSQWNRESNSCLFCHGSGCGSSCGAVGSKQQNTRGNQRETTAEDLSGGSVCPMNSIVKGF